MVVVVLVGFVCLLRTILSFYSLPPGDHPSQPPLTRTLPCHIPTTSCFFFLPFFGLLFLSLLFLLFLPLSPTLRPSPSLTLGSVAGLEQWG
jgi:hypothetical protein